MGKNKRREKRTDAKQLSPETVAEDNEDQTVAKDGCWIEPTTRYAHRDKRSTMEDRSNTTHKKRREIKNKKENTKNNKKKEKKKNRHQHPKKRKVQKNEKNNRKIHT